MTLEEARVAVLDELNREYRSKDDELVLLDDKTLTKKYGWIFFYNSKRFMETRNFIYALGGNGPVVLERESGRISRLGTARSAEEEVAVFERVNGL